MRVTRKIFNKEKRLSPVKVIEMTYRDYIKKAAKIGLRKNIKDLAMDSGGAAVAGSLIYHRDKKNRKKSFIFIHKYSPVHIKVSTLFHEIGHYHCEKNNCSCYADNSGLHLEEVHAEEFCIKTLIEKKYYTAIGMWMSNVVAMVIDPFEQLRKAYQLIVKKPIWAKCIRILTEAGHGKWVKKLLKELNKKRRYS